MVKAGVGMSCFTMPGDQIINYPSQLNQVDFSAQQVTTEMQGLEVSGILIWSIYRGEDGPFRAYKNFGDELAK